MHGSTAGTLLPLLLNALHGNLCQHGVGSVDAVAVESDFVHVPSIRGQGRSLWVMVDGSATEHQISDGVGVSIGTTPADRFTLSRAHPDHAFFAPCLSDAVGVVHVGRPVATVSVKGAPC